MYPLKDDFSHPNCSQHWPKVSIANKLAQQITRLGQAFGMTPSARWRRMRATPVKHDPEDSVS